MQRVGATASILFVPAGLLRDAALEAIGAGMDPIVLMVDGVPLDLSLELVGVARERGVTLIGPNSPGVISPGKSLLGALRADFYSPGDVALISRSGGMMTTIAYELTRRPESARAPASASAAMPSSGSTFPRRRCSRRPIPRPRGCSSSARSGPAGGAARELVRGGEITKPVYAYIAGASAPAGQALLARGRVGGRRRRRRGREAPRPAGSRRDSLERYIDAREI